MKYIQIRFLVPSHIILIQNLIKSRIAHCMYMIIYILSNKKRFERIGYLIKWIHEPIV